MTQRGLNAALLAAVTAAALSACAPHTLPPTEGSAASASPTTGGPLDGTPTPDSKAPQTTAANTPTSYECRTGAQIQARYPDTDTALVGYRDQQYRMHIAVSADGARYVGDQYEWWTHGTGPGAEASLFEHARDGSTGALLQTCHAVD